MHRAGADASAMPWYVFSRLVPTLYIVRCRFLRQRNRGIEMLRMEKTRAGVSENDGIRAVDRAKVSRPERLVVAGDGRNEPLPP